MTEVPDRPAEPPRRCELCDFSTYSTDISGLCWSCREEIKAEEKIDEERELIGGTSK